MHWKARILLAVFAIFLPHALAQESARVKQSAHAAEQTAVPSGVARLVRPILDARQEHEEGKLNQLLYGLIQEKGRSADEALVVLMCFDVGDSQEEVDAVIARGKRMLPIIRKYRRQKPQISGRRYPAVMLRGPASKADTFNGAVDAIIQGLHSSAENAER